MPEHQPLRAEDLDPDPIRQFQGWFEAAVRAGIPQPEAAAVASASTDGRPSCRMVLIKEVDEHGFVFYTNYESRKGQELEHNGYAALLYHWPTLERQVRVEGPVQKTSREQSVAYAHSRARASQLSAIVSAQSRPVADRATLERRVAEIDARGDETLEVPDQWGGLRLTPERFEFWQGGEARLHDRFVYEPSSDRWTIVRLQP